jgi:lipopolysaccharide biosynthesis regulator YciM
MTFMSFLLLVILFLVFFIYFSSLNPQEITLHYFPDQNVTYSVAIVVVACILLGLVIGYLAHLYTAASHLAKHWQKERAEKSFREVAAIYRDGVGRLLSGDIKKAHTLLQRALDRDPARIETYIALASVYLQEGDPHEGLNLLLKARSLQPKSLEVLFKLAATYEDQGRDEEAAQIYQEILPIENDNRKALRGLRDLHIKHGRWQEALDLQKRIIKAGPGSKRLEEEKQKLLFLRYEVARIALAEGKTDQAKTEFRDIIGQARDFTPARVSLGDAYQAQGRNEDAIRVWMEGYRALGRSIFLSRIEDLYMAAEDPATLLSFFRTTLMERADDLMLRLFYGKVCLRLEMIDDALEQLNAVRNAGVEFGQLHQLLAEAHRRRNRAEEAITEYKKALGLNTRLSLGYICDDCGETSPEWQSRCPACGTWGSFALVNRALIQNARPLAVRAIHHGEREEWVQE